MNTTLTENPSSSKQTSKRTSKRRKRAAKFTLAAVGLVGVGAALTSAAWTDDVWFATDTSAATVDLQGSVTGEAGTWYDIHDGTETSAAAPIVVDPSVFENLLPGDVRTVTVHVRNAGSVDAALGTPTFAFTGEFEGALSTTDVGYTWGQSTPLDPDAATTLAVTVTVPTDWAATNMGATGTLLITVTGSGQH